MTDRVKLGETPLVRSLAQSINGPWPVNTTMLENAGLGSWVDNDWFPSQAGRALLQAAELWDAMPEADEEGVAYYDYLMRKGYITVGEAASYLADCLEAKRRNEEAAPATQGARNCDETP